MINHSSFEEWFTRTTGHKRPWNWQIELCEEKQCRNRLCRIPTGLGKTEGVLTTWLYHRVFKEADSWPRRLVWCLPMRVLVEQTLKVATTAVQGLPEDRRPEIVTVMGGEDAGKWFLRPEKPSILIGTQDMLLSRALNRGYGSGRARWPVEFGLLHQDALWVMDEVQLMDVGMATSAQLQAFRDQDRFKSLRPCYTWWMSATLQPDWLKSVDTDTDECYVDWIRDPCKVPLEQRRDGPWDVTKGLVIDAINQNDNEAFAERIRNEHANIPKSEYGRITLVVCNTVERACSTYDAVVGTGYKGDIKLVHSRFRPVERTAWRERFLSRETCTPEADRIIIATQVVEAGVDISAGCLITELAPWPSLVQRFGRCARYGGSGTVLVVDRGHDEVSSLPYQFDELDSALKALQQLTEHEVGIAALEKYEESLSAEARARLYSYSPSHLLMRKEFDELFDTTPDLTGADLDISRFIRSGDERDLQVFWIDIDKDKKGETPRRPAKDRQPNRRELCSVPFLKARDWLCGEETKTNRKPKLRAGLRGWVWDWLDGEWKPVARDSLLPGRVVCVAADSGGYRAGRGFDPNSRELVTVPSFNPIPETEKAVDEADDQQEAEVPGNSWKTIACHTAEVANTVEELAKNLKLTNELQNILSLAALWHDWGKSHSAFQGAMRSSNRPDRTDLAKGPKEVWRKPPYMYKYLDDSESRPAFRHELASALGLFSLMHTYAPQHPALLGPWSEVFAKLGRSILPSGSAPPTSPLIDRLLRCSAEGFDLLCYLVASHHGKVRVALHASPKDQDYQDRDGRGLPIRGIREGDRLPAVALSPDEPALPEVTLTLAPAALGLSDRTGISWRERCIGLTDRYGPAGLAFLEAILRAADARASCLNTDDPTLATEVSQ